LITTKTPLLQLDLNVAKKEDLSFISDYEIKMTGPGILNGGVFWFDFVFSKGLKKNKFSSDP